jgi:hypothetical protein
METLAPFIPKFSLPNNILPPKNYLNSPKVGGGSYKLYNFKSDSGATEQAYVLAESRAKAIEYLLTKKFVFPKDFIERYHNDIIDSMANFRNGYVLEAYPIGEVLFSELN